MKTLNQISYFFVLTPGVSKDAEKIEEDINEIQIALYGDVTAENPRKPLMEALNEYWDTCSSLNWDGYGAKPINAMSNFYAHQLIRFFPPALPNPEVGVDPDGEISFEWFKGPREVFSVSIAPNGDLHYAGLFGRNKVHGAESFGDVLPKAIMDNLKRLFITRV